MLRKDVSLKFKNDPYKLNSYSWISLYMCTFLEYYEITELLMKLGSDVNAQEVEFYQTPLIRAALVGEWKAVFTLILFTEIKLFFWLGNEKLVKLLLDGGADIDPKTTYSATARSVAEDRGMFLFH